MFTLRLSWDIFHYTTFINYLEECSTYTHCSTRKKEPPLKAQVSQTEHSTISYIPILLQEDRNKEKPQKPRKGQHTWWQTRQICLKNCGRWMPTPQEIFWPSQVCPGSTRMPTHTYEHAHTRTIKKKKPVEQSCGKTINNAMLAILIRFFLVMFNSLFFMLKRSWNNNAYSASAIQFLFFKV